MSATGINHKEHDIRFVEDDWESPTLGAAGLGWEVWCDGMEITQYILLLVCTHVWLGKNLYVHTRKK